MEQDDKEKKIENINVEYGEAESPAKQKLVKTTLKIFSILKWLAPAILCIITFWNVYKRGYALKDWEWSALIIKSLTLFIMFAFGSWLLRKLMKLRAKIGLKG